MDEVAIDFAKEINGISIQEGVEYVAYIYVEYKTEPFFDFGHKKKYYFYTEPFTEGTEGAIHLQTAVDPVSGKYISAAIHTHGAWMRTSTGKGEELNEDFSLNDMLYIEEFGKPFYLVTPTGKILRYDINESIPFRKTEIMGSWKLPHDKTAPGLPRFHSEECENCY